MTDIVDEIIAVIEAGGGRNDPELGIVLPPTPALGDELYWKDVVALALAHVVEKRWEAKAREKAKWAAAALGHWVWEDGPTVSRGTDGEYVATIHRTKGLFDARYGKPPDGTRYVTSNVTLEGTKANVANYVARMRDEPVTVAAGGARAPGT